MILFIIIAVILLVVFFKLFKIPKLSNMVLVTGGVKTGKSTMTVWLALRQYKRQYRKYWINNNIIYPIAALFIGKKKMPPKKEKPLFYSNIPIAVKNYVPLTHDLIARRKRFTYGSVIYICEASLVADSMTFKNDMLNEQMLLLNKLIGHETKGGYLFYDTQSLNDNHFSVRRCLSQYFYIHHLVKLPFVCVAYVREMKYSDDASTINNVAEDLEESLKRVLVPKRVWKYFDCYCYSAFTDNLPVETNVVKIGKKDRKKADNIISFKKYKTIQEFVKEDDNNEQKKT